MGKGTFRADQCTAMQGGMAIWRIGGRRDPPHSVRVRSMDKEDSE